MLGLNEKPKNAEQRRWRAESDARTLAEADVIQKDSERLAAAQKIAAEMAEQATKEAAAIGKVAKLKYKDTKEDRSGSENTG